MNSTKNNLKENYEEIHWWQFPLDDFSVKFSDSFKKDFFEKIYPERSKSLEFAKHINKISRKYDKNWNFKRQRHLLWAYKNKTKFIPAWFVYETALYFNIDMLKVEENIVGYLTFRGKNQVYNPKLPVLVTPEFTALVTHTICDGCFTPSKKINYTQKDKNNVRRFIEIIGKVFGKPKNVEGQRKDGIPSTYTPQIFAKIISNYCGTEDFSSFNCRIPNKIKSLNKLHKLAVLSSFLLDDGYTNSGIVFSSSSKGLIADTIYIAKSLGYKCNSVVTYIPSEKNKNTQNHYKFSLSARSLEKFYLDLKYLFKKFPSLRIGKKFENIENELKIRNRSWIQRNKGETKKIILNALKEGNKTAYELRDLANISVWTVYHHLQQLMKKGKVTKFRNNSNIFLYNLV